MPKIVTKLQSFMVGGLKLRGAKDKGKCIILSQFHYVASLKFCFPCNFLLPVNLDLFKFTPFRNMWLAKISKPKASLL